MTTEKLECRIRLENLLTALGEIESDAAKWSRTLTACFGEKLPEVVRLQGVVTICQDQSAMISAVLEADHEGSAS